MSVQDPPRAHLGGGAIRGGYFSYWQKSQARVNSGPPRAQLGGGQLGGGDGNRAKFICTIFLSRRSRWPKRRRVEDWFIVEDWWIIGGLLLVQYWRIVVSEIDKGQIPVRGTPPLALTLSHISSHPQVPQPQPR